MKCTFLVLLTVACTQALVDPNEIWPEPIEKNALKLESGLRALAPSMRFYKAYESYANFAIQETVKDLGQNNSNVTEGIFVSSACANVILVGVGTFIGEAVVIVIFPYLLEILGFAGIFKQ